MTEKAVTPAAQISAKPASGLLQRQCACGNHTVAGGECAECRKKREAGVLQRAAVGPNVASEVPPIVYDVLRSPGQPLDAGTRAFMEPRFGHDFSGVRVHTDAKAAESARAVNALAYTVGREVVFGDGQYAPTTNAGRRLMAHELTHVVQQSELLSGSQLELGARQDAFEREADRMSAGIAHTAILSSEKATKGVAFIQRMDDSEMTGDFKELDDEVMDGDFPAGVLFEVDSETEKDNLAPEASSSLLGFIQFEKGQGAPAKGRAQTPSRTIVQIDVNLSSQTLSMSWSDGKTSKAIPISSGKGLPKTKEDPCKNPNVDGSNCTPTGEFLVGKKGGANYKNQKGDRMSWYVEFESNRGIGIHNSQPVTGRPASHGCVRIDEATARLINKNVTGNSKVVVSGKAPTVPWAKTKPKAKSKRIQRKPIAVRGPNATHAHLVQRQTASGLEMWQTRADPDIEAQRQEAFSIIVENRGYIHSEAAKYKVSAEAIAGAIFWEALENPYKFKLRPKSSRLGAGKVHYTSGSEAEKVEQEGRIKTQKEGGPIAQLPKTESERHEALKDSRVAITYIAAIMRRHADNYLTIAGVDISSNIGVLCTLYQGGNSEERARRLAEKRKTNPNAQPQPGDEMGPWVLKNLDNIRAWISPPPRPH